MNNHYKFINTPLPYMYEAMEPYIDKKTMYLHHNKHLQNYIDNLNNTLSKHPELQSWSLEQLIINVPCLPKDIQTNIKNNSGGVFNHQFYFSNLANPTSLQPVGILNQSINNEFGSYLSFQEQFKTAALTVFGSGYAWLVVNATGNLCIITTQNQDTPLEMGLFPVLNIDVWEHAYYLKHYYQKSDYIDDWFHIINWNHVNQTYMSRVPLVSRDPLKDAAPTAKFQPHLI
ncbi:superoxide dismutase [Lachnospiraceae bacterium JLR.KK008]